MGLGENQDLLPDPSLDGQIKLQNRLIRLYGIFQQCSQHSVHTGYSNRRWPWCVGSGTEMTTLGQSHRELSSSWQELALWRWELP